MATAVGSDDDFGDVFDAVHAHAHALHHTFGFSWVNTPLHVNSRVHTFS
jgi:hypothetical protein